MRHRFVTPNIWAPLGAVLFIIGAKLALIDYAGSDQPFADQWAAEGAGVIRSSQMGLWQFKHFFAPHGEHTPTIMRIVTAATTALNSGQWDSRLEMLVSVGALSITAWLLWQIADQILPNRWRVLAIAGAVLLLAMPCNKENYLWGFQTPFVALITFGLAHLYGTLRSERIDLSWCVAQIAGGVAIFTLASGWLSAVVIAAYAGLRLSREPRSIWCWMTLAANLAIIGLGIWMLTHAFFAFGRLNGSPQSFVSAFGYLLAWPFDFPWLSLILQSPALILFWVERRNWMQLPVRLLMGLQCWCWLLAAAFAWGRGAGPGLIAGRYQDHLTLGLVANLLALVFLLWRRRSIHSKGFALVWTGLLVIGVWHVNDAAQLSGGLRAHKEFFVRQMAVVSDSLKTNDPAALERDPRVRNYLPHLEQTKALLMDPVLRTALPPSLAESIPTQIDRSRSSTAASFRDVRENQPSGVRELSLRGGKSGVTYVSEPIGDDLLPIWRFQVSGKVGRGASRVVVRNSSGVEATLFDAEFDATGRWKTVHLRRPAGLVRLEIFVPAGSVLSITEPVGLGRLSWLFPKVAERWLALIGLGLALLGIAGVVDRDTLVTRAP